MNSLTQVAYVSRRIIKYGGVGLLGLMVVWWGLVAAVKAYQEAHPPYVAPSVRYGILPKIVFAFCGAVFFPESCNFPIFVFLTIKENKQR